MSAAAVAQEGEAFKFRAKPVPKVIYNPPKIPIRSITPPIVVEPPKPVNRIQKHRSLDRVSRLLFKLDTNICYTIFIEYFYNCNVFVDLKGGPKFK